MPSDWLVEDFAWQMDGLGSTIAGSLERGKTAVSALLGNNSISGRKPSRTLNKNSKVEPCTKQQSSLGWGAGAKRLACQAGRRWAQVAWLPPQHPCPGLPHHYGILAEWYSYNDF